MPDEVGIDDDPELRHGTPVRDRRSVRTLDVQLGGKVEGHLLGPLRLDDPSVLGAHGRSQLATLFFLLGRQRVVPRDHQKADAVAGAARTDREVERLDLIALVAALLQMDRERQLHPVLAPVPGWMDRVGPLVPAEVERVAVARHLE